MKTYREIDVPFATIDEAVAILKEHDERGELARLNFNGIWLYSDTVTLEDAYQSITGKSTSEHDKELEEFEESIKKEENVKSLVKKESIKPEYIALLIGVTESVIEDWLANKTSLLPHQLGAIKSYLNKKE